MQISTFFCLNKGTQYTAAVKAKEMFDVNWHFLRYKLHNSNSTERLI